MSLAFCRGRELGFPIKLLSPEADGKVRGYGVVMEDASAEDDSSQARNFFKIGRASCRERV